MNKSDNQAGQPAEATPFGVHFTGSIPLSSSAEVFQRVSSTLPNSLLRIPDGETGARGFFVFWQDAVFLRSPFIMHQHDLVGKKIDSSAQTDPADQIVLGETGFDEAALASYQDFMRLRNEGIINPKVRFQVSLPTPINVVAKFATPQYQPQVDTLYEKKLLKALRKIQDSIPAKDLAIQWDVAVEFAMLENLGRFFTPWFSPVKEGIMERLLRLSSAVDEDVQMGYHLCYGDKDHKHFMQPKDTSLLVDVANSLSRLVSRPIQWVQIPVPKDRTDEKYFNSLKDLELHKETDIYLGLVHPYDLNGTWDRIKVARMTVPQFGITTECGLGRAPVEEFDSVLEIFAKVMGPNA